MKKRKLEIIIPMTSARAGIERGYSGTKDSELIGKLVLSQELFLPIIFPGQCKCGMQQAASTALG